MQRTVCSLLLLILGVFLSAPAVRAEQGILIADEVFADYENERLVARGDVVFTYQDYEVRGDEFYLDLEEDRLSVPGRVLIKREDETVEGENLVFYFVDEEGSMDRFVFLAEAETGEPIIIKARQGEVHGEKVVGAGSVFTGCNQDQPHYHLTAEKTVYYPEDRIELYHAAYWEGKIKFPAIPKLVISLQEQENDFDESTFGYNAQDGFFLKMVYRYVLRGEQQGKILVDLIQGKGVGEGIKHQFPVGEGQELSVSLYHLDNFYEKRHDYQVQTSWQQTKGNLRYQLQGKYNVLGYSEYGLSGNINYQAPKWPSSFVFETGQTGASPEFYLYPCRLNITWQLGPRSRLTYRNNLYYREKIATKEIVTKKYQNNFEFEQGWDFLSWQNFALAVRVKQDYNYSERYQIPYYHELPSISFRTPPINLGFPGYYQGSVDYLRLVEIRGEAEKEGIRTQYLLERRPLGPKLWTHGGFSLDLANSNRYQVYRVAGTEFRRYAVSIGLTGTERFTPNLTWTNTVSWVEAQGDAPVEQYPRLVTGSHLFSTGGHLTSNLRYNTGLFSATLEGGYNFSHLNNPWYPLEGTFVFTPFTNNSLRLQATYNLNTKEYTNLYLTIRGSYNTEKGNRYLLEADYDFLDRRWETLELAANLQFALTTKLRTDVNLRYSLFGDGLEQARLGLNYDWHCRELFFGYDCIRREYLVQCQYKIFKEAGFGYGSGEQGFIWTGADQWGAKNGNW
ncbi:MAG: hypothetical protein GX081_00300 [Firmicutes bacterium]|nr:hypothetical protein [Bacillota bacterium]